MSKSDVDDLVNAVIQEDVGQLVILSARCREHALTNARMSVENRRLVQQIGELQAEIEALREQVAMGSALVVSAAPLMEGRPLDSATSHD